MVKCPGEDHITTEILKLGGSKPEKSDDALLTNAYKRVPEYSSFVSPSQTFHRDPN